MADVSYQPNVYRKHGGNELVVASSGTVTVESGGTIAIESGGAITNAGTLTNSGSIANTGAVTNSSAGSVRETVTTKSTAQTLDGYGATLIGSTSAGALEYKLKKPAAAGCHRYLTVRKSTAGGLTIASATGSDACKFNYSKSKITAKTALQGETLHLFAPSSTTWTIVGYSTAAETYTCT